MTCCNVGVNEGDLRTEEVRLERRVRSAVVEEGRFDVTVELDDDEVVVLFVLGVRCALFCPDRFSRLVERG